MKNVYLAEVSTVYGEEKKNAYIPYAIGCLAAFAWSNEKVKSEYNLGRLIYTREEIQSAVKSLKNPYLIGLSSYIWNMEYNKAFAKELKKQYPECIVVMGGHHIGPTAKQLNEIKEADILIHGGGEEAFCDLLLKLSDNGDLNSVFNISYRDKSGKNITTPKKNPETKDYPSPYLTGIFDGILNDGIEFSALLETNRGCPNQCAFCDWGQLKSKVRLFDLEKVKAEIRWIAEHKIEYVYGCDANFGLFERDIEITEYMVKLKKERGYPKKFKVNFTKNKFDNVGKISKLLFENDMSKAQTISLQSVSPEVLSIIGRKNLNMEYYSELVKFYAKENIPTYTELILGLPGETYESFSRGICSVIESGQHTAINVYPCELIPNSLLGSKEYIEKYQIKTTHNAFVQYHINPENTKEDVCEYSALITSTNTMTGEDWEKTYLFAVTVQALHTIGITRHIAVALRKTKGIGYFDFYNGFLNTALKDENYTFCFKLWNDFKNHFNSVRTQNGSIGMIDDRFGYIIYEPDEMMFLKCLVEKDAFFKDMKNYLLSVCDDVAFIDELIMLQKFVLNEPNKTDDEKMFNYDFALFFNEFFKGGDVKLVKKEAKLSLKNGMQTSSWADFAREVVWYSRRMPGSTILILT